MPTTPVIGRILNVHDVASRLSSRAHYMTMHGKQTKCGVPRRLVHEAYESAHRVTCNDCRAVLGFSPLPLWEPSEAATGGLFLEPEVQVLHNGKRFAFGWYERAQTPTVGVVSEPPPGSYSGIRAKRIHLGRLVLVFRFPD